jgi:hypothetical protein
MLQEIQSLKIVLDLRNAEIGKLKQTNAELEKQVLCASLLVVEM